MKLSFQLDAGVESRRIEVDIQKMIVAGWSGRDIASIEHHIEEMAVLGVARPSALPLYYRIANNQLTQEKRIQVIGDSSSGEVETFIFSVEDEMYVSIASDHTDRKLEAYSVAFSKQACAKPVGNTAWRFSDVVGHWDELVIRSYIQEDGAAVLYQEGPLASLRTPADLIARFADGATALPRGLGMSCGTVGAIGGIRPSTSFSMELFDPHRQRTLEHHYDVEILPEVA